MRRILLSFIITLFTFNIFSEEIIENTNDADYKINQIQKELDVIKKDVQEIKDKNLWFSFKLEGSTKVTFGAALWTKDGHKFNTPFPVTLGFDFDNNIRMTMDLANKIVASNTVKTTEGTEVIAQLKIKSNGLSKVTPEGSYYVMDATDDQGKKVKVYFPRYTNDTSTNIVFGNFEVVFDEAKIKNIMGTGVFVSYKDVFEVQRYYGVTALVEVLKLNHDYFNNGFFDNNSILYYSFDDEYYNPESKESTAVQYWNDNMLFKSTTSKDATQKPHGISFGFDKKVSDGVDVYVEGGGASKDAFDPKYLEDNQIDAGFFVDGGVNFYNKKFSFYPKLAFSFAFQTETTDDISPDKGYNTFSFAVDLPFFINLPTGKDDYLKISTSFNLNAHFATSSVAGILTFLPELRILNRKLFFQLPIIYSFKTKNGGFIRVGNESVKWLDQEAEDHIVNLGFLAGFDTTNLLGDYFQILLKETFYFSYNAIGNKPEIFLYQLFRNEFVFNDVGPKKLTLYYDVGLGYTKNPRIISTNYYYDSDKEGWYDKTTGLAITIDHNRRWNYQAYVLNIETGFYMDIIKNLSLGVSIESPKILLGGKDPIGTQNSFGMFKIWSEIKL